MKRALQLCVTLTVLLLGKPSSAGEWFSPIGWKYQPSGYVFVDYEEIYDLSDHSWRYLDFNSTDGPWTYVYATGRWYNFLPPDWNYIFPDDPSSYLIYNEHVGWCYMFCRTASLWYYNYRWGHWGTVY